MFLRFLRRAVPEGEALLFDYDGVIADSGEVYFAEFTRLCAEMGFDRLNSKEAFLALFDHNLVLQLIRAGFPLRRLKELESENSRLKKIVAQQALDIEALKDLLGNGL